MKILKGVGNENKMKGFRRRKKGWSEVKGWCRANGERREADAEGEEGWQREVGIRPLGIEKEGKRMKEMGNERGRGRRRKGGGE